MLILDDFPYFELVLLVLQRRVSDQTRTLCTNTNLKCAIINFPESILDIDIYKCI